VFVGDLSPSLDYQRLMTNVLADHASGPPIYSTIYAGDLSYADRPTGTPPGSPPNETINDIWANVMTAMGAVLPLDAIPGNHELGDYQCGPYNTRIGQSMPSTDPSFNYWSYDFGKVHVAAFSTDCNGGYDPTQPQWTWLVNDIQNTKRRKDAGEITWSITVAHKAMFSSNLAHEPALDFQAQAEPIFNQNEVDFAVWGHDHCYERTYPMISGNPVSTLTGSWADPYIWQKGNFSGTMHFVVGMGGVQLAPNFVDPQPQWSLRREAQFGYTVWTFYPNDTVVYQFKRNDNTEGDFFVASRSALGASPFNPPSGGGGGGGSSTVIIIIVVVVVVLVLLAIIGGVAAFFILRRSGGSSGGGNAGGEKADANYRMM